MNPKISVIVPVYKAEKYLHRCVDSILAQTFTDFEVLLIDDGSPDRSGEICDEYAEKDSRVRVFHKENGGVSSARQCGIDNAQGEYTIHADPDDWVEPNMLEELYAKAQEDDADMVICDYFVNHRQSQLYQQQRPSCLNHIIVLKELFEHLHGSCCNKLLRKSCYKSNNIKYDHALKCKEDLIFNIRVLLQPISISYVPKAYYHYDHYSNDNSLVRTTSYEQDVLFSKKLRIVLTPNLFNEVYPNIAYQFLMKRCLTEVCSEKKYKFLYSCLVSPMLKARKRPIFSKFLLFCSISISYKLSRKIITLLKNIRLQTQQFLNKFSLSI